MADPAGEEVGVLGTRTPEGTRNIVAVAARGHDAGGRRWVQVRLAVLPNGRRVLRAPVGIGTPAAPTPAGEFYVRNRLTRYRGAAYGPVAFGTSARSPGATDWPAGGFVGIHGTDRPDLVPGRVSHGCIRMRNPDILALARLMPVGTPVTIAQGGRAGTRSVARDRG